ncbi:MAG: hypothetical protein MUP16_10450, partial [Sedimentisphaerales bacterium]|nr:hypothetical protein [Sedimentisphaerales bacterium]
QAEENKPIVKQEQTITFIPYYAWANRGKGQMDVWVAREKNLSGVADAKSDLPARRSFSEGGFFEEVCLIKS